MNNTETALRIGSTIRDIRKEYRLTQADLAQMAAISDRTLRDIEKGTGTPSLSNLLAVADVLGLRIDVVNR